ncbi:hypothetical protein D4739_06980 [Nocardioides cavernaquae]|uniref:Uncharacterized protein n=1 Tax=Nocardioides cavernaquae TaxID=2321396 RepID=A0A3A5HDB7_9ACTN|nr:hypothetical protein D4739_06980 [Nocardioides cavernaquae]
MERSLASSSISSNSTGAPAASASVGAHQRGPAGEAASVSSDVARSSRPAGKMTTRPSYADMSPQRCT